MYDDAGDHKIGARIPRRRLRRTPALINEAKIHPTMKPSSSNDSQVERFKQLARELGCDEDEATFDETLKRLAESEHLPKREPKKRTSKTKT
jgi:hypothetical protein